MKYTILTLAAPIALGSLTSAEGFEQAQSSQPGIFDYFAPASTVTSGVSQLCQGDCQNDSNNGSNAPQTTTMSSNMSVQCQGDCQNDGPAAPNAEGSAADQVGIRGLLRQFIGPMQTSSVAGQEDAGHLVLYNTPVYEMVYNYMFSQEPAASALPTQVNRFAGQEVAGDSSPVFSQAASLSSAYQHDSADDGLADFDFSSWGRRVDNAAQRLVSNVEAVVIRYLSATPVVLSTPTAVAEEYAEQSEVYENSDLTAAAATANADRFEWF
ncbi:hypothetical protein LPJ56_006292 [Coemansia sp. RSA 2599]|nr:hypothetical protein LPJ56_006292 [Coemansia sp. RSA 2599]